MSRNHRNKYIHLSKAAQQSERLYRLNKAKLTRHLLVIGKPGEVIQKGLRVLWHDRLYELAEDAVIPNDGKPIYKLFKLCRKEI